MNLKFFLRWSLRDARERWLLIVCIALIAALGTAVFSAFGNQREWRVSSLDRSFEILNIFDLRMELTEGSFVEQADIESALSQVDGVEMVDTRLLMPTLLDASKDGETILYPGRIIGLNVSDGGPTINKLNITEGRGLTAADAGENVVVIDYLFTKFRELEPGDPALVAGGIPLDFVGRGQTPENFVIIPGEGGLGENENTFAVMYTSLETAQHIFEREGLVNDILLKLDDDADLDTVEANITALIDDQFDHVGFEFTRRDDDPAINSMYADARGDQRFWNIIGSLFLFGGALATFNLAGRIVEAQRRQIGIGMALGVQRHWLAFRPLLLGLQIAALGTIFGIILGYPITHAFATIMEDYYPLPYWRSPFYWESYLLAVTLGLIVPILATLYPVVRAVRVQPVDAIQTGYLVAKGGGLAPLIERLPLPGHSFMQMPIRNVLRSPWRSFLTVIGVAIAIMLLIAVSGILDTFDSTIDQANDFYMNDYPDRINVMLDGLYPMDASTADPLMATVMDTDRIDTLRHLTDANGRPLLADVDVGMLMIGEFTHNDTEIMALIEMMDPQQALWKPDLLEGELPDGEQGIVISKKTSDDLNIGVGDSVTLSHPLRENMFTYRMMETDVLVTGIHDNPMRPQSYMSLHQSDLMGVGGLANMLTLYPAKGVSQDDIRRALFQEPGIASVQVVKNIPDSFKEVLALLNAILIIVQIIVVVMAFLITFNSTSISIEERNREIATMLAFGLRIRTVIRMQAFENFITGVLGTLLGIGTGYLVLMYIMNRQVEDMVPDINFAIEVSQTTLITAIILGMLVVSLTPLLSIRRMWHMDIPGRLRVLE